MPSKSSSQRQVEEKDTIILKEVESITGELEMEVIAPGLKKDEKSEISPKALSRVDGSGAERIDPQVLSILVRRSQNDDHEAFGKIYDAFVTPIYRYVAFRVPRMLAEDIVSDVFVKAWEKLGTYKGRKGIPFSSWLFRIAHNVVIDAYRTQRSTVELEEVHIDEDRWNDPTLKITQERQSVILRQAMNKLPKRYREVLLLSFMSELSHGEIASILRMREGSVRILKHRALKKLAEHLPVSMRDELP